MSTSASCCAKSLLIQLILYYQVSDHLRPTGFLVRAGPSAAAVRARKILVIPVSQLLYTTHIYMIVDRTVFHLRPTLQLGFIVIRRVLMPIPNYRVLVFWNRNSSYSIPSAVPTALTRSLVARMVSWFIHGSFGGHCLAYYEDVYWY